MINVAPVHVVLRELKPQNKWSLSQLSGGGSFCGMGHKSVKRLP